MAKAVHRWAKARKKQRHLNLLFFLRVKFSRTQNTVTAKWIISENPTLIRGCCFEVVAYSSVIYQHSCERAKTIILHICGYAKLRCAGPVAALSMSAVIVYVSARARTLTHAAHAVASRVTTTRQSEPNRKFTIHSYSTSEDIPAACHLIWLFRKIFSVHIYWREQFSESAIHWHSGSAEPRCASSIHEHTPKIHWKK